MSPEPSSEAPFLTKQLIPYLGNKRALLRYMRPVFQSVVSEPGRAVFMDPFAGSGSVSRLARSLGFAVRANDWEPYSECINRCWLELSPGDLSSAFERTGGIEVFLDDWNRMHPESTPARHNEARYMARWYAPAVTNQPDLDGERLFYSAENALFIDRVRYRLENLYPSADPDSPDGTIRRVVLGTLLLEAATHTNTSGVFKAYHRGFGGHGADALKRILARMRLETPILVDAPRAKVHREDARAFCTRYTADLVYIDPPYNQHQYGSNYHILNTIVRWDEEPVPLDRGDDGRLVKKAGIPEAAALTRSPYCSNTGAAPALAELFDTIDSAAVVVSWNSDAHLSAEQLADLLSPKGELKIVHLDHTSYRGGRQSASRVNRTSEYLFIVDCRKASRPSGQALARLAKEQILERIMRASYHPDRIRACFTATDSGLVLESAGRKDNDGSLAAKGLRVPMRHLRRMDPEARPILGSLFAEDGMAAIKMLESCACSGVVDELDAVAGLAELDSLGSDTGSRAARREAPRLIRKLAHRKYHNEFRAAIRRFRGIAKDTRDLVLLESLTELEKTAAARFSYVPEAEDFRKEHRE